MIRRYLCLCLLGLAGCTFTAYEKELAVRPPEADETAVAALAAAPAEESWMQFLDFNHIVDSLVELFKHTAAKEAMRHGVHYTERKRFLHVEFTREREDEP